VDAARREQEVAQQTHHLAKIANLTTSTTAVLERLAAGLEQATFEQRRQLIELLVDRVIVTDTQVEIRYVIPTTEASTTTRFCDLRTNYFHALPDQLADGLPRRGVGPPVDGAAARWCSAPRAG
jgi:site-specific DNA recombinase